VTQRPHATRGARPQVLSLPEFRDERGCLSAAEGLRHVPFAIERVYWITEAPPSARRGGHAHREVLEVIAAAAGSFTVDCDDGDSTTEFSLQAPSAALLVPAPVWREVRDFSPGAVCLVLASGPYREEEYIRDREEFSQLVDAG
jgi:WxcM-like protein